MRIYRESLIKGHTIYTVCQFVNLSLRNGLFYYVVFKYSLQVDISSSGNERGYYVMLIYHEFLMPSNNTVTFYILSRIVATDEQFPS